MAFSPRYIQTAVFEHRCQLKAIPMIKQGGDRVPDLDNATVIDSFFALKEGSGIDIVFDRLNTGIQQKSSDIGIIFKWSKPKLDLLKQEDKKRVLTFKNKDYSVISWSEWRFQRAYLEVTIARVSFGP